MLESKKIITPFMYGGVRKGEFPPFWLEFGKVNIFYNYNLFSTWKVNRISWIHLPNELDLLVTNSKPF